jgi:hypothetical protein
LALTTKETLDAKDTMGLSLSTLPIQMPHIRGNVNPSNALIQEQAGAAGPSPTILYVSLPAEYKEHHTTTAMHYYTIYWKTRNESLLSTPNV